MSSFWESTPVIRSLYWRLVVRPRQRREQQRWANASPQHVFTEIFQSNHWNDPDSRSGGGSNLEQTAALREALPGLFSRYGITRLLDVPCGDFHWMSTLDLSGMTYLGGDIVPTLVEQNNQRYRNDRVGFRVINLIEDPLPQADAMLVRDCLVHLSHTHALQAIANIRRSRIRYLLTTHFPDIRDNEDIVTGQWRMLNLTLPPFNFPPPLELINERCTESRLARSKSLAVWRVNALPA